MVAMPATVTIRDVELVRAGTWEAITGRATVTVDDLDAMVAAAQDSEVDAGVVKIGHVGAWAALGDSAPALGWIANVRRAGDRIIGDLVDVPAKLAAIMPKAFRRRSVEFLRNVTTPSGTKYAAALSGLALLGVQPPAVKGLADLLALYETDARPVAAADGDLPELVTVDVIEQADGPAATPELVAAAASALAATVTAGDATQDAANAILDRVFATSAIPEATIPPPEPSPSHTPSDAPPTGGPMPVDEARLRELLGIEEDADVEATLTDVIARANATPPAETPPAETPPAETPPATPPAPAPVAERELVAAAGAEVAEDGTVRFSAGAAAALISDAQAGRQALAALDQQARDALLDDALRSGRIAPAERETFAATFAARPTEELRTFLGGLAPRFATVELGGANPETDASEEAWSQFTDALFGNVTGGI
jgi:hypothetical protein